MTSRTRIIKTPGQRRVTMAAIGLLLGIGAMVHAQAAQSTLPAKANQTWRCTSQAGVVSYSQQPCEGQAELKQMADDRSTSQLRQSRNNNLRDAKLARQMQRERRHEERMAGLERPVALSSSKPHVIKATANDHRPKPISDQTRPVKIRSEKKQTGRADTLNSQGSPIRP